MDAYAQMTNMQILRIKQVIDLTGLSRSTIYQLMAKGLFPRPVQMALRTSGWLLSEINDYICDRVASSRRGAPTGAEQHARAHRATLPICRQRTLKE